VQHIRQGSIASPILFCVYLDQLLNKLQKAGNGCWLGNKYFGTLAYADDVTLLSPTATGLQSMVDMCEQYGVEYGMQYNVKKTVCTLFTRQRRIQKPQIMLSGKALQWVECVKHLGNFVSHDLSETEEISKKKCDLIGRVNAIVGGLTGVNMKSHLKILQSQCSFYGAQAWHLRDSSVRSFHSTFNRCIRRIMNLPYATHTRFLPELSGLPHSKDSIANRMMKLYITMWKSSNEHVSFIAKRGRSCAHSIIGSNLRTLSREYSTPIESLPQTKLRSNICSQQDLTTVAAVKDIVHGNLPVFFTSEERTQMLHELCEM
jgi:hypothetical protein